MPWLYQELKSFYTVKPLFLFFNFPYFLMHLGIPLRSYPSQITFNMFRKVLFRLVKKRFYNILISNGIVLDL